MTVTVRHLKVSAIPDDSAAADAGEVLPSDWNAGHVVEIDALDGVPIGAATPAAGTFTTLIGGGGSANYGKITGGATTKAVEFTTLGSDTNIAAVIKSKGTGAIDLAAGSSGVNISNGGTVTAITRTAAGSGYTSAPTVTISAPTTAGGVQATATCTITAGAVNTTFTITNAGSGYVEQPTVTFSGGGGSGAAAYARIGSDVTVKGLGTNLDFSTPNGTGLRVLDGGQTSAAYWSVGGGTNAVFRTVGNAAAYFDNNNAQPIIFRTATSSEQFRVSHTASAVNYVQVTGAATGGANGPTISAQGSDATIPLTVIAKGSAGSVVLGSPFGVNFRAVGSAGVTVVNNLQAQGSGTGSGVTLSAQGSDTNIDLNLTTKGTGNVVLGVNTKALTVVGDSANNRVQLRSGGNIGVYGNAGGAVAFYTNDTLQAQVTHTASAVNYVQVTGAATGGQTQISSQGSDASVPLSYVVKGFSAHRFCTNSTTSDVQFMVGNTTTARNYIAATGATVGNSPKLETAGSDTNIDLTLTPKGTGNVRFGTYTADMTLVVQGYITIKDSGGTVRKLAVIA